MPAPVNPSRRSFLKWGAALAGASLAAPDLLGRRASAAAGDEYGGLPIGLQSYTLRSLSFEKMLEAMGQTLTLSRVELYGGHLAQNAPPPKIEAAKEKLRAAGVTAVAFGVVNFSKDYDKSKAVFEFARTMGLKSISADPDPDSFDTLDKLVEEYKIPIAIHDHGPGHRWGKIATIQNAIKDHHKLVGLCNDTGHFIRAGEDPLEACRVFKDRLYGLHLKDFKKDEKGKWEDCVLGDGSLKVEPIVKFLLEMKYDGVLSIEYEGGDPVASTQKSLDRIRAAVKA